jgi:phage I-like protein
MRRKGMDRVALDFEHNTVPGSPAWKECREPRAVAAYGVPRLAEGDGLYLDDLVYTPNGLAYALDYIDLSPAVRICPRTGEVDFLHSAALTRAGAVEGLSYYSIEAHVPETAKGDDEMEPREMMCAFAGVAPDASDEALTTAFSARIAALGAEAVQPVAAEITALSARVDALRPAEGLDGEITALSSELATVKEELTALSGELVAMRRRGVCEQAAREGKVIPLSAEQIAAMAPETLAEMVGKLPVTVPLDRRTPEHIEALSAAAGAAVTRVARNCGIDPARVAEVNRKRD